MELNIMHIKLELISNDIAELVCKKIDCLNIDVNTIAQTKAITILKDIQNIIKNDELSDFEIVEAIVQLFEKNNLSCGSCHDF